MKRSANRRPVFDCLFRLAAVTAAIAGSGCAGSGSDDTPLPGWADAVALPLPVDQSTDPAILEVSLEAAPGTADFGGTARTPVWTYGGTTPGPLLHARRGDTLIVHFTNHLSEPTTIHWHGVRVPSAMDGTPMTQDPVEPGGTFDYRFVLPDAGLFWYHPHVSSALQLSRGLYGALLVDDPETPVSAFGPEVVLMLSDTAINADGTPIDDDTTGGFGNVFGREGKVLLVNGRINPELLARRGERQRWRVVNAARSRFYRFSVPGAHFTRIGGDGGLSHAAVDSDEVMIVPGERADLLVTTDAPVGTELQARWLPYDRGYGTDATLDPKDLLRVRIAEDRAPPPPMSLPTMLRAVPPIDLSSAVAQSVVLGDGPQGSGLFTVNGAPSGGGDDGPGTLHARVGETDVITVDNQTGFDHPFHLHGFFYQVLDPTTGTLRTPAEWKDTVNVPQMSTVKLAVAYDDRPGMWMFHCHILDHADAGMMGMVNLQP